MAVRNEKLIKAQYDFLKHADDFEFGFVAGVGTGKSTVGSLWTVNRTFNLGENILVGSQTWSTTKSVQFKAITEWLDKMNLKENKHYTYNKDELLIKFNHNKACIKGCCSAALNSVTGATNFSGAWFDEAYLWDKDAKSYVYQRCRGIDSNGNPIRPHYRFTGTSPLEASGWYYDWLIENPDKYVRASSTDASIEKGAWLSKEYLDGIIAEAGGVSSDYCKIQIFAELPKKGSSLCIFNCEHKPVQIETSMGIDVAGAGADNDAVFITDGINILYHKLDNTPRTDKEKVEEYSGLIEKYNVKHCRIDNTGGYGKGVTEGLQEKYNFVQGILFGEKALKSELYGNVRAEMYNNCALRWNDGWTDDNGRPLFEKERNATLRKMASSGKTIIIAKEDIKKKLGGKSPDGLDALCLALYDCTDFHPCGTADDWARLKSMGIV